MVAEGSADRANTVAAAPAYKAYALFAPRDEQRGGDRLSGRFSQCRCLHPNLILNNPEKVEAVGSVICFVPSHIDESHVLAFHDNIINTVRVEFQHLNLPPFLRSHPNFKRERMQIALRAGREDNISTVFGRLRRTIECETMALGLGSSSSPARIFRGSVRLRPNQDGTEEDEEAAVRRDLTLRRRHSGRPAQSWVVEDKKMTIRVLWLGEGGAGASETPIEITVACSSPALITTSTVKAHIASAVSKAKMPHGTTSSSATTSITNSSGGGERAGKVGRSKEVAAPLDKDDIWLFWISAGRIALELRHDDSSSKASGDMLLKDVLPSSLMGTWPSLHAQIAFNKQEEGGDNSSSIIGELERREGGERGGGGGGGGGGSRRTHHNAKNASLSNGHTINETENEKDIKDVNNPSGTSKKKRGTKLTAFAMPFVYRLRSTATPARVMREFRQKLGQSFPPRGIIRIDCPYALLMMRPNGVWCWRFEAMAEDLLAGEAATAAPTSFLSIPRGNPPNTCLSSNRTP
eukprot:jgi/Bigna1/78531/fgenesh1_pg.55_\